MTSAVIIQNIPQLLKNSDLPTDKLRHYMVLQQLLDSLYAKGEIIENEATLKSLLDCVDSDASSDDNAEVKQRAIDMQRLIAICKWKNIIMHDLPDSHIQTAFDDLSKDVSDRSVEAVRHVFKDWLEHDNCDVEKLLLKAKNEVARIKVAELLRSVLFELPLSHGALLFYEKILPVMYQTSHTEVTDAIVPFIDAYYKNYPVTLLSIDRCVKLNANIMQGYLLKIDKWRELDYAYWGKLWIFLVRCHGDISINNNKEKNKNKDNKDKEFAGFNTILKVTEAAFRSPLVQQRAAAYDCWKHLIDYFASNGQLYSSSQFKLILVPLKYVTRPMDEILVMKRWQLWMRLLFILNQDSHKCVEKFLKFCFNPTPNNLVSCCDNAPLIIHQSNVLSLPAVHAFLQLIGHDAPVGENCCLDCEMPEISLLKLDGPVITCRNFLVIEEIVLHSVNQCFYLVLKCKDTVNITKVISCLWNSLFKITKQLDEDNQRRLLSKLRLMVCEYLQATKDDRNYLEVVFALLNLLTEKSYFNIDSLMFNNYFLFPLLHYYMDGLTSLWAKFRKPLVELFARANKANITTKRLKEGLCVFKTVTRENSVLLGSIWCHWATKLNNMLCYSPEISMKMFKINEVDFMMWPVLYLPKIDQFALMKWKNLFETILKSNFTEALSVLVNIKHNVKTSFSCASNASLLLGDAFRHLLNKKSFRKLVTALLGLASEILSLPKGAHVEHLKAFIKEVTSCFEKIRLKKSNFQLLCNCYEYLLSYHQEYPMLVTIERIFDNTDKSHITVSLHKTLNDLQTHSDSKVAQNARTLVSKLNPHLNGNIANDGDEVDSQHKTPNDLQTHCDNNVAKNAEVLVSKLDSFPNGNLAEEDEADPHLSVHPTRIDKIRYMTQRSNLPKTYNKGETPAFHFFGNGFKGTSSSIIRGSQMNNTKPTKRKAANAIANLKPCEVKNYDEDANTYVPINDEYEFDPKKLSEHQLEVMKKRKIDIPALYQDLSQSQSNSQCLFDTQKLVGEGDGKTGDSKISQQLQGGNDHTVVEVDTKTNNVASVVSQDLFQSEDLAQLSVTGKEICANERSVSLKRPREQNGYWSDDTERCDSLPRSRKKLRWKSISVINSTKEENTTDGISPEEKKRHGKSELSRLKMDIVGFEEYNVHGRRRRTCSVIDDSQLSRAHPSYLKRCVSDSNLGSSDTNRKTKHRATVVSVELSSNDTSKPKRNKRLRCSVILSSLKGHTSLIDESKHSGNPSTSATNSDCSDTNHKTEFEAIVMSAEKESTDNQTSSSESNKPNIESPRATTSRQVPMDSSNCKRYGVTNPRQDYADKRKEDLGLQATITENSNNATSTKTIDNTDSVNSEDIIQSSQQSVKHDLHHDELFPISFQCNRLLKNMNATVGENVHQLVQTPKIPEKSVIEQWCNQEDLMDMDLALKGLSVITDSEETSKLDTETLEMETPMISVGIPTSPVGSDTPIKTEWLIDVGTHKNCVGISTSPVGSETSSRTFDFLNDTIDISPIRSIPATTSTAETPHLLDFEESVVWTPKTSYQTGRNEGVTRSAKLLSLVSNNTPRIIRKRNTCVVVHKRYPSERIKKMQELCKFNPETSDVEPFIPHETVQICKLPDCGMKSILKKSTLNEELPAKNLRSRKKRVHFCYPLVTSMKYISYDREERAKPVETVIDSIDLDEPSDGEQDNSFEQPTRPTSPALEAARTESQTESLDVESQGSVNMANPQLLDETRPICPELVNCSESVHPILQTTTSPMFIEKLEEELTLKKLFTVGDLASLTEVQINRLPFNVPKVEVVSAALNSKQCICKKRMMISDTRKTECDGKNLVIDHQKSSVLSKNSLECEVQVHQPDDTSVIPSCKRILLYTSYTVKPPSEVNQNSTATTKKLLSSPATIRGRSLSVASERDLNSITSSPTSIIKDNSSSSASTSTTTKETATAIQSPKTVEGALSSSPTTPKGNLFSSLTSSTVASKINFNSVTSSPKASSKGSFSVTSPTRVEISIPVQSPEAVQDALAALKNRNSIQVFPVEYQNITTAQVPDEASQNFQDIYASFVAISNTPFKPINAAPVAMKNPQTSPVGTSRDFFPHRMAANGSTTVVSPVQGSPKEVLSSSTSAGFPNIHTASRIITIEQAAPVATNHPQNGLVGTSPSLDSSGSITPVTRTKPQTGLIVPERSEDFQTPKLTPDSSSYVVSPPVQVSSPESPNGIEGSTSNINQEHEKLLIRLRRVFKSMLDRVELAGMHKFRFYDAILEIAGFRSFASILLNKKELYSSRMMKYTDYTGVLNDMLGIKSFKEILSMLHQNENVTDRLFIDGFLECIIKPNVGNASFSNTHNGVVDTAPICSLLHRVIDSLHEMMQGSQFTVIEFIRYLTLKVSPRLDDVIPTFNNINLVRLDDKVVQRSEADKNNVNGFVEKLLTEVDGTIFFKLVPKKSLSNTKNIVDCIAADKTKETMFALFNRMPDVEQETTAFSIVDKISATKQKELIVATCSKMTKEEQREIIIATSSNLTDEQQAELIVAQTSNMTKEQQKELIVTHTSNLTEEDQTELIIAQTSKLTKEKQTELIVAQTSNLTEKEQTELIVAQTGNLTKKQQEEVFVSMLDRMSTLEIHMIFINQYNKNRQT